MNTTRTTIVDHVVNVALAIVAVAIVLALMAYVEGGFTPETDAAQRTADTVDDRAADYADMHAAARFMSTRDIPSPTAESQR